MAEIKIELIESLVGKIVKQLAPEKVILFGSVARGESGPDSDIDLCIIKDGVADKIKELVKFRRTLQMKEQPLDLLIFSREEFQKRKDLLGTVQFEIAKEGKVMYECRN